MYLVECLLTGNECYKAGRKIKPQGICVHSTGANNPYVRRYAQPTPTDSSVLKIIGTNQYGNHWNRGGVNKCVHAFIGYGLRPEDGVLTCKTLPWNWRGWHAGQGKYGSLNNTHISFEICEDSLQNEAYFNLVMREAQELCAMLCHSFGLDPSSKNVILSHHEGALLGKASNHGDIDHWLKLYKRDMNWFRSEVCNIYGKEEDEVTEADRNKPSVWAKEAWEWATKAGITDGTRPTSIPTREEVATMLYRYHNLKKE